jgi:hypothetical protein
MISQGAVMAGMAGSQAGLQAIPMDTATISGAAASFRPMICSL